MKKRKIIFYISVFVLYLILLVPITYFGALFFGLADFAIVVIFGLLNTYISNTYFKTENWKSLSIGFLISSVGLTMSYILFVPFMNSSFFIAPLLLNAATQTIGWKLVEGFFFNKTNINLIPISVFTILSVVFSFNLYEYWKFEKYYNWNEKKRIVLKIIDSKTGESIKGDSIRLSAKRPLLYGLPGGSTMGKTITDKNGISEFMVYPKDNLEGCIWENNEFPYDFFLITPQELNKSDTIKIKTTANTVYN